MSEFTRNRVRIYLTKYSERIDKILESYDDIDSETLLSDVKELFSDIKNERHRAIDNTNDIVEETNYIPALDEALKFLEVGMVDSTLVEMAGALSDASFSINYYLQH